MMETHVSQLNIGQQLAGFSPTQRKLIELRLMQKNRRAKTTQSIKRSADRTTAPLSYNQQGLWVLNQLMPGESLYHSPTAARLTGPLNVEALVKTLQAIVARHDGLRTIFKIVDGAPQQVVQEFTLDVPLIDLSEKSEAERDEEALRILRHETRRPFDLSQGPLIRAVLLRMQEQEHVLLVTMHHIVTDGWSIGIFHRELSALYEAFASGKPSPFSKLPIQYGDYSVWQREWFDGEVYESQLAYWKKQFATLPPALELPTDHARPNVQAYRAFRGAQQTVTLPAELTRKLRQTCQKESVTVFMMLMAAYQILLHRYTGEEDIVVGTPIAGRQQPETEDLIGLFINTIAMRADLSGDPTVCEFLNRVRQVSLGAYAHQDLPFERLVKELQPERTLSHNPLFQVMFVLQNEEILPLQLPGLKAEHFRVGNVMANFDLTLDIVEKDDEFVCLFESNADLFDNETIQRMMQHFQNVLEGIVANPKQRISQIPLLTERERRELLVEWNETKTEYPANKSVGELFEEQVERTPDAPALVFGDQRMSYRELNAKANQLANYLRTLGVGPEVLVGVRMERSASLIVALLGIVKAGGAYLPLDLSYPQERVAFMLADAKVPVLLTEKALLESAPATDAKVICLDENWEEIAKESEANPPSRATADNLIYVIYTSGSTGTPKGVSVAHRAINRLVFNTNYVEIDSADRIAQASNASFDAATFEVWGALLHGAQLVGVAKDVALSPRRFAAEIQDKKISVMFLTTALFNQISRDTPRAFSSMRQLMFGGEACDPNCVREVLKHGPPQQLMHVYGPTESTTFATWHLIESVSDDATTIPIGRPLSNTTTYIVDRSFNPVSVGVAGELYLGGDGLARGYLNRPELTNERFVANPFSHDPNDRLYRTGDVARYLPDGSIEFVGRKDHQVKIRGFRIELGEIETALNEHESISESIVTVIEAGAGDKRLAAYFVPANGVAINAGELRDFLRRKLPDYMAPTSFVALDALPLSPNGKVDRRALPAPDAIKLATGIDYAAPADELELMLTKIWEKVLGLRRVGIDDNFFDLGGHSLLAVQLFAQIEKAFNRNLPLATLFHAPTIKQLAAVLREEGWPAPWSSLVMIQPGAKRRPFFCVHAAGGNVLEYRELARLLGPDQPFYGFQAQGLDGRQAPHTSIKEMAVHYIKEMREVQPEGPYLLGGRSSGGTIAFEMACQLLAAGEQVAMLALLDTFPAGYFKLLPGNSSLGQRLARRAKKWQAHLTNLRGLSAADKLKYLATKLHYAPAKAKHKIYRRAYKIYQRIGRPLPPVLKNIEEINFTAVKDYEPQIYSGDVTLFLASDLTADYDSKDGWRELVRGNIETHEIPGNHLNIIKEPGVNVLAEKLKGCLATAEDAKS
jgi:aspartate racemase